MPLKVNVGASKKVTDNNYGSRGASVNVEMELDNSLVAEPGKLQERIRQLFGVVRSSLAEEINGNGSGPANATNASSKPATAPANTSSGNENGNGSGNGQRNNPRPATQSQVKAIHAIARTQGVNLSQLLRGYHVTRPDDLSIKEASHLIDALKNQRKEG